MRGKSKEIRLISFSAEPFELHGEHCWLTIGRDVTERKHVEQQREQLLRQETAAREDAEAANRMKDEFLATISHELRTPLTSIMGWARILIDSALPEAQTRHALQVIEQSAKSQARLIDDILDTSRIITGRLILDRHPIDMEHVFLAAIDVIRPSAEAKGIELRIAVHGGSAVVFGDANRLQQAIWNLLSNAVKFTDEQGRVEAGLTRQGTQVEISVSDTGIGIDPQFLPYVFERFRQADSTSTRRYGGLGLGLAIVRHVVEMHGGKVEASSAGTGRGAQFKIKLPVAWSVQLPEAERRSRQAEITTPDVHPSPEVREQLNGICVLVVEDDADTLELIRFVLDGYGAEVLTASSVAEALETLDRRQPHVLISDLAMPDRDGYELIASLRSRPAAQGGNIPAIALTAYARPEERARALAAGYQMHVAKPVDPKTLVVALAGLTKAFRS
jgi:signal transduction histidine kinase/CheY-like chemotaxis protein